MKKSDAKRIAETVTSDQLAAMFDRAKVGVTDWEAASTVNKGRTLRQQTGLTQRQLAALLQLSRRTIQNYESTDEAPAWYVLAVRQVAGKVE